MKVLMLLVYLLGGEPKSEVLLFDNALDCMTFGQARIARLAEQHEGIQGLISECIEIDMQGA